MHEYDTRSDEDLLDAYARGEAQAARLLTARLGPMVFGHALRMLGGDAAEAEDVAQDALLRLWRTAPDWQKGRAKPRTWLYRVTANLCIDRMRKRKPGPALDSLPDLADGALSVDADLLSQERASALQAALMDLPERQREAVILRHIEGLANPQIAEVMELNLRAVESLIARGKRGLERALFGRKAELGLEE